MANTYLRSGEKEMLQKKPLLRTNLEKNLMI